MVAIKGCDYTNHNMSIAALKANGIKFVCRYLSANPGGWKELSLAEAKKLSAAGIHVVSNWETTGKPANTIAQGKLDGARALAEAKKCGAPSSKPIYFSIDSDVGVTSKDLYFQGLCSVLGVNRVGAYGSAGLLKHLHSKGLIKYGWRSMSSGWNGYPGNSTYVNINQTGGGSIGGVSVDHDTAIQADYGGWLVGELPVPPIPPVKPPVQAQTHTPGGEDMDLYQTRVPLATKLPLKYQVSPKLYTFVKCAELIIGLKKGDLVQVVASGEASTDTGVTRAMHARFLKASMVGNNPSPTEGIMISKAMGTNVTAEIHHSTLDCAGNFVAPADGAYHILLVMYAANLVTAEATKALIVNYVDLQAVVSKAPQPVVTP